MSVCRRDFLTKMNCQNELNILEKKSFLFLSNLFDDRYRCLEMKKRTFLLFSWLIEKLDIFRAKKAPIQSLSFSSSENIVLIRVLFCSHTENMRCMYQRMRKKERNHRYVVFSFWAVTYLLECQLFKWRGERESYSWNCSFVVHEEIEVFRSPFFFALVIWCWIWSIITYRCTWESNIIWTYSLDPLK